MSLGLTFTRAWLAMVFAACAVLAQAQDLPAGAEPAAEDTPLVEEILPTQTPEELSLASFKSLTGIDYAAWQTVAVNAESQLASGKPSTFALERLRADVLPWRELFAAARGTNLARITTVEAQLSALGAAAEGEDPAISARRTALNQQLAALRAPSALASEGYIRADGIVAEIDKNTRASQAAQLLTRNESLLSVGLWPQVASSVSSRVSAIGSELKTTVGNGQRWQRLEANAVPVGAAIIFGLALMFLAPAVATRLRARFTERFAHAGSAISFIASVGRLAAQIAGVYLLTYALKQSGLFGYRINTMIAVLPEAGIMFYASRWVGSRFFTRSRENPSPFDFTLDEKNIGRRLMTELGSVLALGSLVSAFMATGDTSPSVRNAVSVPIVLFVAFTLFRLGRFLAKSVGKPDDADTSKLRQGILWVVGMVLSALAVIAPILSIAGYARAAEWMLYPSAQSLFIAAALIAIQWFVFDVYALIARSTEAAKDSLLPVLFGILLILVAIPVLALIWGARMEDLVEVGGRIAEGVTFGDITLSPAAIVIALVLFAIGSMVTRLVQSMLQSSVLPKTRLDKGGQAAVVSVVGYIGIVVSALFAITSAGLNLSSFAVVAGALSVGIGFGLQDIVKNFVSGIILVIGRPVSQGDWIEVAGFSGYVREISIRSTRIETFDRSDVIIPNADLVSGRVVNWTRGNSVGRITVAVTAAYGSDPEQVMKILREVVEAQPLVLLSPPPSVQLTSFAADTMNFEVKALVRDINAGGGVRAAINLEVAKRLTAEGIQTRNGLVLLPEKLPENQEDFA